MGGPPTSTPTTHFTLKKIVLDLIKYENVHYISIYCLYFKSFWVVLNFLLGPFGFLLGPFGFLLGPFGFFWVLLGPFG